MSSFLNSWKTAIATLLAALAVVLALITHSPTPSPTPAPLPTWTWPVGTRTPIPMTTPGVIVVHGTPYACLTTDDATGKPSDEPPGQDYDAHNCPGVD